VATAHWIAILANWIPPPATYNGEKFQYLLADGEDILGSDPVQIVSSRPSNHRPGCIDPDPEEQERPAYQEELFPCFGREIAKIERYDLLIPDDFGL